MDKINLPPLVLHEIASTALNKAKINVFLTKKELAYSLKISTKTVERTGIKPTFSNGKNVYNIKDVIAILDKNYTGKSVSFSAINSNITELLQDYTQILIKKIMIDNPSINLNVPVRWIMQDNLIKHGLSERKLYYLRKTKKLAYSMFPNSMFYYKLDDIIDYFKNIKNDDIDFLVKNSLFYQYIGR